MEADSVHMCIVTVHSHILLDSLTNFSFASLVFSYVLIVWKIR